MIKKTYLVKDIGVDFGDAPFGTALKSKDYTPEGIPIIQGQNIVDQVFEWNRKLYTSEEKFKSLRRSHCNAGDLVFPKIGNRTVGSCAIAPVIEGHLTYLLSTNMMKMSVNAEIADIKYVYYFFCQPAIRQKIISQAGGGAQPIFNFTSLKNFEIELVPLPIQRKIADVLSAYDDLIEVNTRRIHILEQMAKTVYREWFGKVDVQSVPEGWKAKSFGELLSFDINGGWGEEEQTKQFSVPAYVIRGTDIPGGRYGQFDKVPYRYHKQSNFASRQLINGDIVIEIAGGSKGQPVGRALLIGRQLLEKFDNQVICASFCKLLRPNQSLVSSEYLYLHLREIYENGVIEKYQTQSTGIVNFKSTFFLEDNTVIVPNRTTMDKFTEFARPIFEMIGILGVKNANLRRTRDLLLPRLVSGEVRINEKDVSSHG